MRESQKRAIKKYKAKYKDKVKQIRFDCFPTDTDIKEHLEAKKAAGEATATYLKRLIREDMQKEKEIYLITFDSMDDYCEIPGFFGTKEEAEEYCKQHPMYDIETIKKL